MNQGDTLALIIPFLLLHNVSEDNITTLAAEASLTGGAAELISWLQFKGWKVFCITQIGARQSLPTLNQLAQRYQELYHKQL